MTSADAVSVGRRPGFAAGVGLAALALAVFAGGWREAAGSTLAAWLVLLALPAGALPVAVVAERFSLRLHDRDVGELYASIRRLVALMPIAAVLALPALAGAGLLYPWAAEHPPGGHGATPLAQVWFTLPFFAGRVAAYLAVWVWLALRFAAPATDGGDARTIGGVGLHAVVGTLFVTDVIGSLDHRLGSSLLGLLLLTAWSGLGLAAAILLAWEEPEPIGRGRVVPGWDRLVPLTVLLSLWTFLHFVQFLIVWSANLPQEVLWYFARGGGFGRGWALYGGLITVLAGLATLRPGRAITRALAGAVVVLHAVEMFWFVTPALRDRFVPTVTDGLAGLGVAGLALALLPVVGRIAAGGRPRERRAAA